MGIGNRLYVVACLPAKAGAATKFIILLSLLLRQLLLPIPAPLGIGSLVNNNLRVIMNSLAYTKNKMRLVFLESTNNKKLPVLFYLSKLGIHYF